jgi:hypothetical protein
MKACSICGMAGEHETRCALIAAQSLFKITSTRSYEETRYTHTDDTTIWELSICTACMPKARLMYLDDKIRDAKKGALWALLLLAALLGLLLLASAVVALCWGPASAAAWARSSLVDFLAAIFHGGGNPWTIAFMAFCFLAAAVALFNTEQLISFSMSRNRMTDRDVVPLEWRERCFEEEFNRILELRKLDVRKAAGENQGDPPAPSVSAEKFPLPAFMRLDQFTEEAIDKAVAANGGTVSQRRWQLIGIYDRTPQDLIADPPAEWRKIMAGN